MPNRVKHLSGEHGGYDYLDPGVGGDPFRNRGGLARYIGGSTWDSFDNLTAGHHESQLLDQSKRSYHTKWLDPWSIENRDFWGHNFATHKYNFSEYAPGDRQHFTGALRRKVTDEHREDDNVLKYNKWHQKGVEHEILDWDAYNLDPIYSSALAKRHGRDKFLTLQDIWDAEEVIKGSWQAPAPPPPPAPPAPPQSPTPQHIDYEQILKDLGIEHEQAIGGWRDQLSQQEELFSQQTAAHSEEIKRLRDEFDQKLIEQQSLSAQEARDLEIQLNTTFAAQFAEQQNQLTKYYDNLLSQAKDDAEVAKINQAKELEQIRLEQEAGWQAQEQEWTKKDAVYQDQLAELAGTLGVQKDMYSGLQDKLEGLKGEYSGLQGEYSGLQGKFGDLQGELGLQKGLYSGLQDQFGQAKEDWSKQQEGYKQEIGDVKTSLAESQQQAQLLGAAVKRNEELAMQNAERARVAASYGSQGKPLNREVQGVRTLNELAPTKKRYTGTRGTFNRQGLRISNLNI